MDQTKIGKKQKTVRGVQGGGRQNLQSGVAGKSGSQFRELMFGEQAKKKNEVNSRHRGLSLDTDKGDGSLQHEQQMKTTEMQGF